MAWSSWRNAFNEADEPDTLPPTPPIYNDPSQLEPYTPPWAEPDTGDPLQQTEPWCDYMPGRNDPSLTPRTAAERAEQYAGTYTERNR